MPALVLAQLVQERVGAGVARRAQVEIVDRLVLGGLRPREQPVDGSDTRLQRAASERQLHAPERGHLDPELAHPPLEALAVPALGLGDPQHDHRLALGQSAARSARTAPTPTPRRATPAAGARGPRG